jgi:hypothetical protein
VTVIWETFFRNTTTLEQRQARLENGAALAGALATAVQNPLMGQAVATVTTVTFDSPVRARVVYDVALNGNVALAAAEGVAVFVDAEWKVSQETFCGLATLAVGGPVAGCD